MGGLGDDYARAIGVVRSTAGLRYIGRTVNLKSVRDFILDEGVSEKDAILLHPADFDELALEHRAAYGESLVLPFVFLGVELRVDETSITPRGRVRIERDGNVIVDDERLPVDPVYRCGCCGHVLNQEGYILNGWDRYYSIRAMNNALSPAIIKTTLCKTCL